MATGGIEMVIDEVENGTERTYLLGALAVIEDLIGRLDARNDPDCCEAIAFRLEVLKRFLVNVGIDDVTLQLVDEAYRKFRHCEQRFSALENSAFTPKVYSGRRGKPSYDIHEGQVNYLLEQGFKVGEISKMLGVSKRTLERRMWSFGLSVAGTIAHMLCLVSS